jgi:hypothetical protein
VCRIDSACAAAKVVYAINRARVKNAAKKRWNEKCLEQVIGKTPQAR